MPELVLPDAPYKDARGNSTLCRQGPWRLDV